MNIGENIKKFREKKSLTQKQLGEQIGVTAVTITRYERGDRKPDFVVLDAIADALDCQLYDLLGVEASTEISGSNSKSYFLDQYIHSLGYEIICDDSNGYIILKSRQGEYEIEMRDLEELRSSSQSFIEYKLHEIAKKSRKVGK